jgi:hypothetical protein
MEQKARSWPEEEYSYRTGKIGGTLFEGTARAYKAHKAISTQGNDYRNLGKRPVHDIGGPFLLQRITLDWNRSYSHGFNGVNRVMDGVLIPHQLSPFITSNWTNKPNEIITRCPPALSDNDLDALGTTAISRCAPTNPIVDGAAFIGELRDGMFGIPGMQGNVGGEYLNVVFGIQPVYDDVKKAYAATLKAEKILDQLAKDSGKLIRRRYEFPEERTTTEAVAVSAPYIIGTTGDSSGTVSTYSLKRVNVVTKRSWFSGAFTYHLPESGTWMRRMAELDHLYGIRPGIDTAWELTPFSWLTDWFANTGDILNNVSNFSQDGLVMPYGYIMCHQRNTTIYTGQVQVQTSASTWTQVPVHGTLCFETLQRRPANPFGFGISLGSLSVRQLGILAALGISRV